MTWTSWLILTALCAPIVWALIDTLRDHRRADLAARAAEQAAAEKQRLTARAAQIRGTAVAAEREKARREVHEHALDHLTDSDVNKLFDRIISRYDEDSHR